MYIFHSSTLILHTENFVSIVLLHFHCASWKSHLKLMMITHFWLGTSVVNWQACPACFFLFQRQKKKLKKTNESNESCLFKQQSRLLTWSHWLAFIVFLMSTGHSCINMLLYYPYLSIFVRSIRAATPCKNVALMRVGSAASAVENHFLAPPPHNSLRFHTTESRGSNVKCKQAAPTCELPSEFFLHSDQPHETYYFVSSRKKTQTGRMRATVFGHRWGKQA